jgi:hypothetical protein
MLRVERSSNKLTRLANKKLADAGLLERTHVQQMIRQSADDFFAELGETLLLIGEEVPPTDFVADRIDLLAIDPEGVAVVIEIKRSADKLQLLQAIPYAGMIARWSDQRLREQHRKFSQLPLDESEQRLAEFLGPNVTLNHQQRILLLAEDFDYEVLVAAEWLTENYDLDIRCFRLALALDQDKEYLTCTCAYPPPEISEQSIRRGRRGPSDSYAPASWDAFLEDVDNHAVIDFFKAQLPKRTSHLGTDPNIRFTIGGKTRYQAYVRSDYAYIFQWGRFDGDIEFWNKRLKNDPRVKAIAHDANLRFLVRDAADFNAFVSAVDTELRPDQFAAQEADSPDEE